METPQKQSLTAPFACSPNPVAQLIGCGGRHVLSAYASVRGAAQGEEASPRRRNGNLLESCQGRESE